MENQIRFGTVTSFNETSQSGWLRIDGEPAQLKFNLESQREIKEAGSDTPYFCAEGSREFPMPSFGAHVAVITNVHYEPEHVPNVRRGLRRVAMVLAWDYHFRFKDAQTRIRERPVYEVWEYRFYNGQPVSVNQKELINWGTVLQLQAAFPRGRANDPFASEEIIMGLTQRRRFFERTSRGLVQVPDPRRLPPGVIEVAPPPVNECGMLLADVQQVASLLINGFDHGLAVGK